MLVKLALILRMMASNIDIQRVKILLALEKALQKLVVGFLRLIVTSRLYVFIEIVVRDMSMSPA
jgi:hypothetical protein